jgi:hypothetical protein
MGQKEMKLTTEDLSRIISEELEAVLDEKKGSKRQRKKKAKKKKAGDRCTRIAKRKYDVWPSAYASGAVVKCRQGKIWKGLKEEEDLGGGRYVGPGYYILEFGKIYEGPYKTKELAAAALENEPVYVRNGLNVGYMNDEDAAMMEEKELEEKKKKKPCKKAKGKKFVKRVNGRCRSYGQSGKAKDGGARIRPGTKKGDAYCARSAKIKKCKNPPCANALSRKKWKCRGSKSMKEECND